MGFRRAGDDVKRHALAYMMVVLVACGSAEPGDDDSPPAGDGGELPQQDAQSGISPDASAQDAGADSAASPDARAPTDAGDGGGADSTVPVGMRLQASKVSVGVMQACAVTAAGRLACWTPAVPQARLFSELTGASGVSLGAGYGCAIAAGAAQCWGKDGRVLNKPAGSEAPVVSLAGASEVSAGATFTCAVTSTGVRCWGAVTTGQPDGKQVDVGVSRVCGVTAAGRLDCWGTEPAGAPPAQVLSSGVARVSCGGGHCCLVTTGSEAACWGENESGQIGRTPSETASTTPGKVAGLTGVSRISAGAEHSCALTSSGEVWCWGLTYGFKPVKIDLGQGATEVDAGEGYSCAVLADQSVKCWVSGGAASTISF